MQHVLIETFVWLLGLCVGSFLNVVIYRLPAGLSIAHPARSFCPRCEAGIAWYDNLPILSWLLLRGRCRHCGAAISLQYPLVEALTALAFVLVYHLLLPAASRAGLDAPGVDRDVPLLAAWLVLVAGLLACSAMDMVSYAIDVRVTNAVLAAGLVLHALWPRPEFLAPRAETTAGAAAVAALAACVFMLWWTVWRRPEEPPEPAEEEEEPPIDSVVVRLAAGLALVVALGLVLLLMFAVASGRRELGAVGVGAGLVLMFAVVVIVGGQRRAADEEIHEAIEEERPQARRMALGELAWLTPGILAALGTGALLTFLPPAAEGWRGLIWWTAGDFAPLAGVVVAAKGAAVAAAVGWALRLIFTLVYGREAFGTGDIYMLAAAGAVAGWDIALLGLLLSVGIGLAGWLLGLVLKTTVMIPFGPWLALGFVLALWWSKPAGVMAETYRASFELAWREQPGILLVAVGAMLVGSAAAIILARLVRRFVESRLEASEP